MKYFVIIIVFFSFYADSYDLEDFLIVNDKYVKSELIKLSQNDIGEKVEALVLSDGTKILKDHSLVGFKKDKSGVMVYMFRSPSGSLEAYLWSDEEAFEIPLCDSIVTGGRYVLSGDVYTWKKLNFGQVVHCLCPSLEWLK